MKTFVSNVTRLSGLSLNKNTVVNLNSGDMSNAKAGSPGVSDYPTCEVTKPGEASCVVITCPKTCTCPEIKY